MRKQVVLTKEELNEYIDKQANAIIENLRKKKSKLSESKEKAKTAQRITNNITESIMQKMGLKKSLKLNESIGNGLFVEIRFVQGGDDDYNEIEQMFCGEQDGYCEANSQPVIDYLKQWDDGEIEPTPNQPRIARGDTQYADEHGDYTLLYNSGVGGCFLLYRPATEQEIAWYNDNGPGSMGESKNRISESGHLYGHYEDGTPFTNSNETWRGVNGTTFISHGEWSDPEIWYKGKELNATDIEDGLWEWYKEDCSETNEQPTEDGYEKWMETQDLAGYLDDVLFGMSESKNRKVSKYVNETIEYDDYGSISDALAQCGWAYSDSYDVYNRNTGQNGVRYIIEPYAKNLNGVKPFDVEQMKQKMIELLGEENVIFSEGQHVKAPEIKNLSMVVVESDLEESKKKKNTERKRI